VRGVNPQRQPSPQGGPTGEASRCPNPTGIDRDVLLGAWMPERLPPISQKRPCTVPREPRSAASSRTTSRPSSASTRRSSCPPTAGSEAARGGEVLGLQVVEGARCDGHAESGRQPPDDRGEKPTSNKNAGGPASPAPQAAIQVITDPPDRRPRSVSLPKKNRLARLHVTCGSDHIDVDPTRQSTRVPGNGVLSCGQNPVQNRLHFLPS